MSTLAHGVLLPGFAGTTVPGWLAAALADGLAGVCLFAENTPDVPTTRALTDALRAAQAPAGGPPPRPLVVAIDEEGGDVTRLQAAGGSALPGNAALGLADDPELTRRCAAHLGDVLALAGIDLDLAPCLDVASEPLNPVTGVRSFGADPDLVARHGRAFAAGLAEAGVACCGKHYPGHGSTLLDSHVDLPVLDASEDVLRGRDEAPFLALIPGLDAVMTGHLVVPALGGEAASLSAWSARRLRGAGFEGPIVTDALGMRAITDRLGLGEACVRALSAGADLLCLDAPHQRDARAAFAEAVAAIDAAVAAGRLAPEALARSADRTATLARRPARGATGAGAGAGQPVDRAWAALHAVGLDAADRALRTRGAVAMAGPPVVVDVRRRPSQASSRASGAIADALRAWGSTRLVTTQDPVLVAGFLDGAPADHEVVVVTRAALANPAEGAALDAVLARRPGALVVHTGVLAAAPEAARLAATSGDGAAVAEALVARLGGLPGRRGPGQEVRR